MGMHEKLLNGEATMSVVGLGYVGLPIALAFAKHIKVIGFDINEERVEMMRNRIDPSEEMEASDFDCCNITFTANAEDLKQAQFHVVAVPTPINQTNQPDLKPLLSASATVGSALKPGDYVVYESTVYPGVHRRRLRTGAGRSQRVEIQRRFQSRLQPRTHQPRGQDQHH